MKLVGYLYTSTVVRKTDSRDAFPEDRRTDGRERTDRYHEIHPTFFIIWMDGQCWDGWRSLLSVVYAYYMGVIVFLKIF